MPYRRENFCVYRAAAENTFLVAGTSILAPGTDQPARPKSFTSSDPRTIAEQIVAAYRAQAQPRKPIEVTIRVHGYNNRRDDFEESILEDAGAEEGAKAGYEPFRPPGSFYIGYWWQSEGIGSQVSLGDTFQAIAKSPAVGWALFLMPLLGLFLRWLGWPPPQSVVRQLLTPFFQSVSAQLLLGAGAILILLRLSTYLRDRYRAVHYAVPDFGEFVRAMTRDLHDLAKTERGPRSAPVVTLHVIGHSMGALVLVNAFRVLCDYFSRDDADGTPSKTIGPDGIIELGKMILCAADIPALMATPDHNNYFLSVLRRFDKLHVLSSDRDVILKWLSLVANWASEPRHDMAGRKLGNLYLASTRMRWEGVGASPRQWPISRPVWRLFPLYREDPLIVSAPDGTVRPEDRRRLFFHDCTLDASLSGTVPRLILAFAFVLAVAASLFVIEFGVMSLLGKPWSWPALGLWTVGGFSGLVILGLLCRPAWSRARDHWFGGVLGMFIDWPSILVFLSFRRRWNPHSGYFAAGSHSRRLIASLLRGAESLPPEGGVLRHAEITIGT